MANLNDLMRQALRDLGYDGPLNNMRLARFLDEGATSTNINDAQREWLIIQGATPTKKVSDMWKQVLTAAGYSGHINNMYYDFWDDGGVLSPVAAHLVSAKVTNTNPNRVEMTFSKPITSAAYATGVSVILNGLPVTNPTSSTTSPSTVVTVSFDETVIYGDVLTVSYDSGPGDYVDSDSLAVASFTSISVSNNVSQVSPPAFVSTIMDQQFTKGVPIDPIDFSLKFTGTVTSYAYNGTLPAGLTFSSLTGILSGTPTTAQVLSTNTISATNTGGTTFSNNFSVTVAIAEPVFTGSVSDLALTVDTPMTPVDYSTEFSGESLTFEWIGGLPDGLSFNPSTGVLSGTPTVLGTDSGNTVRATNSSGTAVTTAIEIVITGAGTFSVSNQFLRFGDLTLAGAGAWTFQATQGTIDGLGTITGSNASDFNITQNAGTVTIVPATDNLPNGPYTLTIPCQATGETTINVTANISMATDTYTVLPNMTELTAAKNAVGTATTKALNIEIRDGTFPSWTDIFTNSASDNRITVKAENPMVNDVWNVTVPFKIEINGYDKLTLKDIEFIETTNINQVEEIIETKNFPEDLILDRLHIKGTYNDPNTDYSTGWPGSISGIGTADNNHPVRMVVRRCLIEDVYSGCAGGRNESFLFEYNEIRRCYSDANYIQTGNGSILNGSTIYRYNYIHQVYSRPSDPGNPHADMIQLAHTDAGDWYGVEIYGNVFRTGDCRGRSQQGIFNTQFSAGAGYRCVNPKIKGNLICLNQTVHGITMGVIDGGEIMNNTVVHDNPNDSTITYTIATRIGHGDVRGTPKVYGNVTEEFSTPVGGTIDYQDNVTLGTKGATIPYTTAFDGPSWDITNDYDAFLATFSAKALGPLDLDNSGDASLFDIGAVGSGYVTYGQPRDDTSGWSIDNSYDLRGASGAPPVLTNTSPLDNATEVNPESDLVLTFNKDMSKGTGNILVKKYSDDTTVQTIDVTSGSVSIASNVVTTTLATLANSTQFYVTIADGVLKDTLGNNYAGISSKDTLNFTTTVVDTQAPTLSSPTDTANGATASTGSVSTDEANGTLYWVITTSATAPSAAQVKAGQDNTSTAATDSGSQSVTATGVQNIVGSGLTASTAYTTHYMHEDAATNQSTVVSASGFTTTTGSSAVTKEYLGGKSNTASQTSYTITSADLINGSPDAGLVVVVWNGRGTSHSISDVTEDTTSITEIIKTAGPTTSTTGIYAFNHGGGTLNDIVVTLSAAPSRGDIRVYLFVGASITPHDTAVVSNNSSNTINTPADGVVVSSINWTGTAGAAWTNNTEDFDAAVEGTFFASTAASTTTSQTGLVISVALTSPQNERMVSASFAPA